MSIFFGVFSGKMEKNIFMVVALIIYLVILGLQFYIKPGQIAPGLGIARPVLEMGAVLMVLGAGFGLGVIFFKAVFKTKPASGLERLCALGLGFIALSELGFLLCALHLLFHWLVFAALSIAFFYGLAQIWAQKNSHSDRAEKPGAGEWLGVAVLILFLVITLVRAFAPPQQWDEQVYHLLMPKLYLADRGFRPICMIFASFPQNQEMLYTLVMSISDAISARVLHFCCGLATVSLLWLMGKELFKKSSAGIWAAIFFAVSGAYNFEAGCAYVELGLCFLVLLSLYSAYRFQEGGGWRWLVVCGIFSGGALAEKYTALAAIAANALLIFSWSKKQRLAKTAFYFGLSFCFLLPWFAKNLVLVGNPVFPFLTGIFDGQGWDRELFSKYIFGLQFDGMGRRWFDYPALFYRLFIFGSEETTRFDARFNPVLLFLSPVYFLFFRKKQELWIWAWFLTVFIFWAAGPQQGRFLIPGIAALSLISGAAFEKIQGKAGKYPGLAAALLVLCISVIYLPARVFKVGDDLNFISGRKSLEKYLVDHSSRLGLLRIDELLEINRVTPAGARLFLLMENRGFYLERDYLADSAFMASYTKQLILNSGSADSFRAWLKQNNFSYIYNVDMPGWKQGGYLAPETRLEHDRADAIYKEFSQKYGEPVFKRQGELVRVK